MFLFLFFFTTNNSNANFILILESKLNIDKILKTSFQKNWKLMEILTHRKSKIQYHDWQKLAYMIEYEQL